MHLCYAEFRNVFRNIFFILMKLSHCIPLYEKKTFLIDTILRACEYSKICMLRSDFLIDLVSAEKM